MFVGAQAIFHLGGKHMAAKVTAHLQVVIIPVVDWLLRM